MREASRVARFLEIKAAAEKLRAHKPRKRRKRLRHAGPDLEKRRAYMREYNKQQRKLPHVRALRNSADRRRVARKKGLLCACCASIDFKMIYAAAKILHAEVDHRIPLALGGLHCLTNLQILTIDEHKTKTRRDLWAISQVQGGKLSIAAAVRYILA
jgi:5-methylcytosine-specific restriction endonuclease McrA